MNHELHRRSTFVAKVFPTCIEATADVEAPPPEEGPVVIDSCPIELQNDIGSYGLDTGAGGMDAVYQAFELTEGWKVMSLKVSLKAIGAPTGGIVCGLYIGPTGEFPNVIPVSPWLRNTMPIAMSAISQDGGLYEFEFLIKPSLGPGKYAVSVERQSDFLPAGSAIKVGFNFDFDTNGAAHAGNGGFHQNGVWGADEMADMIFYLYGEPL